jgi:hypothetical protein
MVTERTTEKQLRNSYVAILLLRECIRLEMFIGLLPSNTRHNMFKVLHTCNSLKIHSSLCLQTHRIWLNFAPWLKAWTKDSLRIDVQINRGAVKFKQHVDFGEWIWAFAWLTIIVMYFLFRTFCAVYVQHRSLFFLRIPLLDTTYFGLTGHFEVHRCCGQGFCCHSNAGFFPPIVVYFVYFGYVGYHQIYLGVLGLHAVLHMFVFCLLVVVALNVPAVTITMEGKSVDFRICEFCFYCSE